MTLRFETAEPSHARVVDKDVEPALPPRRLIDERLHGKMIAHIGGKRQHARACGRDPAELGFRSFEMLFVDAADRDMCAVLEKGCRNGSPDSA
jgi:hypothetical protein